MEVGAEAAEGLERGHRPRPALGLARRLRQRVPQHLPRRLGHQAVEPALPLDQAPEPLGNGEHHVAVGHVEQHRLDQPLPEEGRALGLARRTQVARPAREGQQMLRPALRAPDPREAPVEPPAVQERVHRLLHLRPPGAGLGLEAVGVHPPVVLETRLEHPVEGRALRVPRPVDPGGRRRGRRRAPAQVASRGTHAPGPHGAPRRSHPGLRLPRHDGHTNSPNSGVLPEPAGARTRATGTPGSRGARPGARLRPGRPAQPRSLRRGWPG